MKKIILFITGLLLIFSFTGLSTYADSPKIEVGIEDSANLLPADHSALNNQAQTLAEKTKSSVYVVTSSTLSEKPKDYAVNYLKDKVGAGNNGIVLLIDMNNRKVIIWATGNMGEYMTSSRISGILDIVQPKLSENDYLGAISGFYSETEKYFDKGVPGGQAYTVDGKTGQVSFHRSFKAAYLLVALLVALIIPAVFVFTIISRYQLKSGGSWRYPYREKGRIKLTQQQDYLVNSFITSRQIPRHNDNDGGSFGGGGSSGSGGERSF